MNLQETIAVLKVRRLEKGMTLTALGKVLHVNNQRLSAYECYLKDDREGVQDIPVRFLIRWGQALGVEIDIKAIIKSNLEV